MRSGEWGVRSEARWNAMPPEPKIVSGHRAETFRRAGAGKKFRSAIGLPPEEIGFRQAIDSPLPPDIPGCHE
jgi:hypothetical protein